MFMSDGMPRREKGGAGWVGGRGGGWVAKPGKAEATERDRERSLRMICCEFKCQGAAE